MIRINLLAAHEFRKGSKNRWLITAVIPAYVVFLAFILIGTWILDHRVQNLKIEKEILQEQTRAAEPLRKKIVEFKKKKDLAQSRLALLENLEKDRHGPVRLMEFLSTILPTNQLWLTALKENGPEIRLEGMSLSNEILADYLKRLSSSSKIHRVDLIQSIQTTYKELRVKQFSLVAWTKLPAPAEEKK
jgi:type IV pilus assembly protein PilN